MKKILLVMFLFAFLMVGFASAVPDCTDSDGGINAEVLGVVVQGPSQLESQDVCEGGGVNASRVVEKYCDGNNESASTLIDCQYGCENGACRTQAQCVESWSCTDWSLCTNNQQNRTCTDSANCGTILNKPAITQACVCTENWQCTSWSDCANSLKTRTCNDTNICNTTFSKPSISKNCSIVACTENWSCTDWSDCANKKQNRTCTDSNKCGTFENKPIISEKCNITCPQLVAPHPDFCKGGIIVSVEDENLCPLAPKCIKSLSNGRKAEIKIMPETASQTAIERLGELNFTIELKEVGTGNNTRAVYELKAEKQGRFLGLFKIKGEVKTEIDAENGEVISVKKPWWAFLASGI